MQLIPSRRPQKYSNDSHHLASSVQHIVVKTETASGIDAAAISDDAEAIVSRDHARFPHKICNLLVFCLIYISRSGPAICACCFRPSKVDSWLTLTHEPCCSAGFAAHPSIVPPLRILLSFCSSPDLHSSSPRLSQCIMFKGIFFTAACTCYSLNHSIAVTIH